MTSVDEPHLAPAPGRRRRNRGSELVRRRLIDAAIGEFAAHGFDGASTRRIADAADAHQSQIRYHFETKDDLWRGCLRTLLGEADEAVAAATRHRDQPARVFEGIIRGMVELAAARPELNRIMIQEATAPSDRLSWLVDTEMAWRRQQIDDAWRALQASGGAAPVDVDLVYHTLIGAASLLYANAPEAERMGLDPADPDLVRRHADALVALFIRPEALPRS